jgi:hypothetical protein
MPCHIKNKGGCIYLLVGGDDTSILFIFDLENAVDLVLILRDDVVLDFV